MSEMLLQMYRPAPWKTLLMLLDLIIGWCTTNQMAHRRLPGARLTLKNIILSLAMSMYICSLRLFALFLAALGFTRLI
jgi:hypothetical protein